MNALVAGEPQLVHEIPGRVRIHLPGWSGRGQRRIDARLRQLRGVISSRANSVTSNVLVQFDPVQVSVAAVLDAAREALGDALGNESDDPPLPHALQEQTDRPDRSRARITVRGIDRDPHLARRIVDHLHRQPGVLRVTPSALTGRVLVEYNRHELTIEDLLANVAHVELPDLMGEDRPAHPLDPGPLLQAATRTIGAGLGIGVLSSNQLTGFQLPPGFRASAGRVSAVIGIVQGLPFVRAGLRRLLGRTTADLLLYVPSILVLTLANSPLGLAVTAAESLRLLTEVIARRAAWRRYEERLESQPVALPGSTVRLEAGERAPLDCTVIEGFGSATGGHGLPCPITPGERLAAGSRVYGGPFVVELEAGEPFTPQPRPAPISPTIYDRYVRNLGAVSLGYAVLTGVITRSASRAFQALLLVNARPAMIGAENADTGASARVLRAGVTVVGTRHDRPIRLPQHLLVDGPRALTDGFEVAGVLPLDPTSDVTEIVFVAAGVAAAAGSPWGEAVAKATGVEAGDGEFDGHVASAQIGGTRYTLGPHARGGEIPAEMRRGRRGQYLLVLRSDRQDRPLGIVALRPRLMPSVSHLVDTCRRHGVVVEMLAEDNKAAAREVGRRTDIPVSSESDLQSAIRTRQATGSIVACASDGSHAGAAFAASDLAIGITSGRSSRFAARADLLAPDMHALAEIVEAGARREAAVRDSVALSVMSNILGAAWGFRGAPNVLQASYGVYVAALAAIADGWARLRGGERPVSTITRLVDPRPERWGRRGIADVLRAFNASETGLTTEEAGRRRQKYRPVTQGNGVVNAIIAQLRSPLTGILAAGAGLSLVLGSTADVVMIAATIAANIVVGVWQERQTGQAIAALERIGTSTARVLRDGEPTVIPSHDVVTGDVLVLAPGDRLAADARVIVSSGLEVDEAALTGESLPVLKVHAGGTDAHRVVLAGSDVTVGTGLAVVVAIGHGTRMGATAAALALDETQASPLGVRLNRMLRQVLPLAGAGGLIVILSGLLRGRPLVAQAAIGASIAIAAVPEGLPLLAGVGEAAVARRLAGRRALVRRLSAVEALGRVDVACTDKTGTLTEGHLTLSLVATMDDAVPPSEGLAESLHQVLLTGGLATPHPDAADAAAHPTDMAVAEGVRAAGMGEALLATRESELPFDPVRSFHAAMVGDRLRLKGAVETLVPQCDLIRRGGEDITLDESGRKDLLARAQSLAERGLRVLMVADGTAGTPLDNPGGLRALGFLGLSDPLRAEVPDAVHRCHDAGVRVIMLTGDHVATARAIATSAGILGPEDRVLTGVDLSDLENGELDLALEQVAVIARVTPLDKLRIVESLQRRGHTVAMTGDGVNDAPALRLADVGVAMGRAGTEVARQAADVVLADDDFSTLVEALVEGRSFWRNIRRALGLLLGGNLGELGLVVAASALGLASPLLTRQILAVNLVTDVLPSLAVALQPPETRNLATLAREGTAALDKPLRNDVWRRGIATAAPSLAAYLLALRAGSLPHARSVAFASIVTTQLAQTLHAGQTENSLTRAVFGAVAGSAAVLVAALTLPPLNTFLGLVPPSPFGWLLIAGGAVAAVLLGSGLSATALPAPGARLLPAPAAG